jgi:predicted chitinase
VFDSGEAVVVSSAAMSHDSFQMTRRAFDLGQLPQVRPVFWYALGGAAVVALISANLGRISKGARLLLTADTLRKAMPGLPADRLVKVLPDLTAALDSADINTPPRIAAFLAQVGMESGDFKHMEELYSGERYEGRSDLGNNQPGDGKRFKGRGPIQLTGRANYAAFSKAMGQGDLFTRQPELVATYEWGFKAAAWFWNSRGLNKYADEGKFNAITFLINGGCMGYKNRDYRYAVAKKALGIEGLPFIKEFRYYSRKAGGTVTRTCCPYGDHGAPGPVGCPPQQTTA